jgi:mono/diheme cytochrome c family protein
MSRRLHLVHFAASAILAAGVPALAADAGAGKAVYDGAKPACKGCHTEVKNPLARAGADNTVDELRAWLRTPKDMIAKKGKKGIMPAYGGDKITDADLENLVAYLATMK